MNLDLISLLAFYIILIFLVQRYKHKFTIQSKIVALYKTRIGLKFMDWLPKKTPRLFNVLSYASVCIGFSGMLFIFIYLVKATIELLTIKGKAPALAPVLPGIKIPGAPTLSFWHWIISIFIIALVHEFAHGIFARLYKVPIKSSGVAIFGPILGAFVEPDEKKLAKTKTFKQLAIFSAGPFSNFVFGAIFLMILNLVTMPIAANFLEPNGIIVNDVIASQPMANTNIETPFVLYSINEQPTTNALEFINLTSKLKPDEKIKLNTDKGEFEIITAKNPENETKGFIGIANFDVQLHVKEKFKLYGRLPFVIMWFNLLLFWLFIISLGVGLFNLLPLGPTDGGRMFYATALTLFKSKKKAKQWLSIASMICLLLIFVNLLPWLFKLLMFIGKLFSLLLA